MRILLLNYEYPPLGGGGGVFSKDLALALSEKHEVTVLTSCFKGLKRTENDEGVEICRVPVLGRTSLHYATMSSMVSFPPAAVIKGLSVYRKERFDIINTHFAVPSGPAGVALSRWTGTPNVLSVHGSDIYNPVRKISPHKYGILRWVVRNVLDNSSRVIAQSNDLKRYAVTIYKPRKDIDIIPLGIPEPSFSPLSRADLGLPDGRFCVISTGRLAKVKGYDVLLSAVSLLRKRGSDMHLTILGDGPERDRLENLSSSLGLEDTVNFAGWISGQRKFQYLSASDLYVLPSLHEGFGVVVLEAMFAGLPVVVTDSGGQVDMIKNGRNGIIVPAGNAEALANAMESMSESREKLTEFGEANRQDAGNFGIKTIANRYSDLFEEVLAKRGEKR